MTVLYLGFKEGLMRVDVDGRRAKANWCFRNAETFSVAVDPKDSRYVYATTIGQGVFRSDNGGRTFEQTMAGLNSPLVFASSVSASERTNAGGVLYVGTMPSAMYRSEDGGRTFRELESFQDLPGLQEAAWPPTPATHMIHMIATSFNREATVMAGIELGGVARSNDGGETWEKTEGGADCHQLLFHPLAPDRVYESDGAGFVESRDNGDTWALDFTGIPEEFAYFYDMAVDPGDPDNVLITTGWNQYQAHGINPYAYQKGFYQGAFNRNDTLAETYSTIYRRQGDNAWKEVREGLLAPQGHELGRFATAVGDDKGTLYYVTIPGDIYRTKDGGDTWSKLDVEYPADAEQLMLHVARATKE
ncbi:hypothetical protein ACFXG4_27435 [Nocardia sp. NPDC059246]|uniref:hypothetical protein n=1 Tax=unclassified Nocardia TaxID=2637762 RepID=UPI003685F88B